MNRSCNLCPCSPIRDGQVRSVLSRISNASSNADTSIPSANKLKTRQTIFEWVFKLIQHGVFSDGELLPAGLALQIPDLFIFSMMTIRYQGMDLFICDQVIFAFRIRTKIVLGGDRFLSPTLAFLLTPWNGHWFGNDRFNGFRFLAFLAILRTLRFHYSWFRGSTRFYPFQHPFNCSFQFSQFQYQQYNDQ